MLASFAAACPANLSRDVGACGVGQHDPGGNGLRSGIDRQDRGLLSVGARALDPHRVATGEAEDVIDCHRLRRAVGGRCRPRRSNASRSGGPSSPPNTGCRGRTGQASPRPGPLVARQINADGGGRFAAQNRGVTDETHVALVGHPRSTRRSSPGSRSLRQLGRCRIDTPVADASWSVVVAARPVKP